MPGSRLFHSFEPLLKMLLSKVAKFDLISFTFTASCALVLVSCVSSVNIVYLSLSSKHKVP